MAERRSLGRAFGWLWAAFAISTAGTYLAFDAFPMVAVLVLDVSPAQVSALAAAGLAVGAVLAVPLGPWLEFRRKRPLMIAMDLVRCAALLTVPAAFALGTLGYGQLLLVSMLVAASDIAFTAASGAYLKSLIRPADLVVASGRFESTTWTATALGPPLGGAAVGAFGPVLTVSANAVSYLLSAAALLRIGGSEPRPVRPELMRAEPERPARSRVGDVLDGWRYILGNAALRPLFFNTVLVNSLIMAPAPLLAVLMLGQLGFAPWQYALGFAVPCVGGLIGARLAPGLVERFGRHRVLRTAGTVRACWPVGLVLVRPGPGGLVLVMAVELGLITCIGVFNSVFAAHRLRLTAQDRVVRTLSAWSVTQKALTATATGLWGLLATLLGVRTAIGLAGLLLLITPLLLPRRPAPGEDPAPEERPGGEEDRAEDAAPRRRPRTRPGS